MRQRLSPLAFHFDENAVRAIGNPTASSNTVMADASVALTPQSIFAAVSPRLVSISPVLSRIQSPMSNSKSVVGLRNSHVNNPLNACKPDGDSSKMTNRAMVHKMRKKNKMRRSGLHHPVNGEAARNLHSLKMTIRRTSQSHKIDSGLCAIVNPGEDTKPTDIISINGLPLCADTQMRFYGSSTGTTPALRNGSIVVDACTSTVDSATLTEPDLLGPCEAGTKVVVEGVVWLETAGMLVLNIQWRGRAYMGTLMDVSKQNFGPSCMDRGVISALSLLRGRKGISYGSPGRMRSRGASQYHRRRSSQLSRNHVLGASVTTRSAAAAAAATSARESSSRQYDFSTVCSSDASDNHSNVPCDTAVNNSTSSYAHRGGARRKRRRGASGRPYRRINPAASSRLTCRDSLDGAADDVQSNVNLRAPAGLGSPPVSEEPHSPHPVAFTCPYPGCEKTFCDLVSMRYHFALGHTVQSETTVHSDHTEMTQLEKSEKPQDDEIQTSKKEAKTASQTQKHCDDSTPSSPPPPLGRAHSTKGHGSDSNENSMVLAPGDDAYDNLAPPRLHRIVSIAESVNGLSQTFASSSPSKHDAPTSPEVNDEPPAPSPAYSDISDDGTVPPEHNVPFLGSQDAQLNNVNNKLLQSGQAVLSPALSCHLSSNGLEFPNSANGSPSFSSPLVNHSGSAARQNPPNGLYFPVGFLSPNPPTCNGMPANTTSVSLTSKGLGVLGNGVNRDRGSTTAVPSSLRPSYAGAQPSTFQLHPSKNLCTSNGPVPATLPAHIPGVNAVSAFPIGGELPHSAPVVCSQSMSGRGPISSTMSWYPTASIVTASESSRNSVPATQSSLRCSSSTGFGTPERSRSIPSPIIQTAPTPESVRSVINELQSRSANFGSVPVDVLSNQFATVAGRLPFMYRPK